MHKELSFAELKVLVNVTRSIEKYIAIKNGNISKFNAKWANRNDSNIGGAQSLSQFIYDYTANLN